MNTFTPNYPHLAKLYGLNTQQIWTGDHVQIRSVNPAGLRAGTLGSLKDGHLPPHNNLHAGWVPALFLGFDNKRTDAATKVYAFGLPDGCFLYVSSEAFGIIQLQLVQNNQALFYNTPNSERLKFSFTPVQIESLAHGRVPIFIVDNCYAYIANRHDSPASAYQRQAQVRRMTADAAQRLMQETDII